MSTELSDWMTVSSPASEAGARTECERLILLRGDAPIELALFDCLCQLPVPGGLDEALLPMLILLAAMIFGSTEACEALVKNSFFGETGEGASTLCVGRGTTLCGEVPLEAGVPGLDRPPLCAAGAGADIKGGFTCVPMRGDGLDTG